jgi:hypothetical protein
MLKSKRSIYILLPLNLAIWGFAGYKVYTSFKSSDDLPFDQTVNTVSLSKPEDTLNVTLSLNYDDPFLKQEVHQVLHRTQSTSEKKIVAVRPTIVPTTAPPKSIDIKYLGLVQNKTTGNKTAMVSINGKSHLVKLGQTVDDVTFASIDQDLINVKIGKEKLVIKK